MQLYHCRVCRLQFYDVAQPAEPAVQQSAEGTRETIAVAEPADDDFTVIGPAMTIRGRVSSQEDIIVHGDIDGDVRMPAHRLTIGTAGRVRGDVLAAEVMALGTIEGNVDARKKFTIGAGGSIQGNLRTPSLSIEEGAFVKGRIETA
jgi:cytoskeletal protein CcmA (bactofilin family)